MKHYNDLIEQTQRWYNTSQAETWEAMLFLDCLRRDISHDVLETAQCLAMADRAAGNPVEPLADAVLAFYAAGQLYTTATATALRQMAAELIENLNKGDDL